MDALVQFLMDHSTLEISLVQIKQPTKDSYVISTECTVSGTGPISSTINSMTVDMCFKGKCFARMELPEIRTKFGGTKVAVKDQLTRILDMETYQAYVHSVIISDTTSFRMENGPCRIKALGLTFNCTYSMEIPFKGMGGPRMAVTGLERSGDDLKTTFTVQNPSPIEISHGMSFIQLQDGEDNVIAELRGELHIVRGEFEVKAEGKVKHPVKPGTTSLRVIGIGVEDDTWCKETIRNIDVTTEILPELSKLLEAAPQPHELTNGVMAEGADDKHQE